jgi:hypothetical protein
VRAALLALVILLALAPGAAAQGLSSPARYDVAPAGFKHTPAAVLRAVAVRPEVRGARRGHAHTYGRVYYKSKENGLWQVSFFAPPVSGHGPSKELSQTIFDDRTGRVLESWTGYKVTWTMARGYAGAFGRAANALWVWLPLCLLFVLPFARPPLRLLHLDLAVLLAFSVSYAFFGAAEIGVSVPLVYPGLVYLLVRMLGVARARSRGREPPPVRLTLPVGALGLVAVFVLGARCGLNLVGSNVIDVGYAGVIGADHFSAGQHVYGHFPLDNQRGDTYGPVLYYAYIPFEALLPWSGTWDDLPAAHAAAITFDLLTAAGLWVLGRRLRGPALGTLLAYAWATFPFTLLVSNSNSNDGLVALLVTAAMLALGRPAMRGAAVAAAALTKFAPIVLAPLFATYPGRGLPARRAAVLTTAAFAGFAALALAPVAFGDGLGTFYDRTLGFQANRGSPFSLWGLYGGLGLVQGVVAVAALALAVLVAFVPRRRDEVSVAALGAAVLIALQLALGHWFYLYLVWFLPLALVALFAPYAGSAGAGRSTGSIDSASAGREPAVERITTAISQGSSSEES